MRMIGEALLPKDANLLGIVAMQYLSCENFGSVAGLYEIFRLWCKVMIKLVTWDTWRLPTGS